jgi:hypothetical protein
MCLASSVWNWSAGALDAGGDPTVIGGTGYRGSVCQVNPATGACTYMWQTGPPCAVTGTPSLDGAGVLAAGTHSCPAGACPGAYLINAATGVILKTLPVGGRRVFSQPVFARGTPSSPPTETQGLYNFAS